MDEIGQKLMAEQAQRERYWNELDREQQLEALRHATVQLFHMVTSMMENVQALMQHQHSATGTLMTPMDGRNIPYAGGSRYIPHSLKVDPQPQQTGANRALGAIHGR